MNIVFTRSLDGFLLPRIPFMSEFMISASIVPTNPVTVVLKTMATTSIVYKVLTISSRSSKASFLRTFSLYTISFPMLEVPKILMTFCGANP